MSMSNSNSDDVFIQNYNYNSISTESTEENSVPLNSYNPINWAPNPYRFQYNAPAHFTTFIPSAGPLPFQMPMFYSPPVIAGYITIPLWSNTPIISMPAVVIPYQSPMFPNSNLWDCRFLMPELEVQGQYFAVTVPQEQYQYISPADSDQQDLQPTTDSQWENDYYRVTGQPFENVEAQYFLGQQPDNLYFPYPGPASVETNQMETGSMELSSLPPGPQLLVQLGYQHNSSFRHDVFTSSEEGPTFGSYVEFQPAVFDSLSGDLETLDRGVTRHCLLCRSNRELPEVYMNHVLKDSKGRVTCPILRSLVCRFCGATGDDSHTQKYCPKNSRPFQNRRVVEYRAHIPNKNEGQSKIPHRMVRTSTGKYHTRKY